MSDAKKTGSRDISELKQRLGLKKGGAAAQTGQPPLGRRGRRLPLRQAGSRGIYHAVAHQMKSGEGTFAYQAVEAVLSQNRILRFRQN